MREPASEQQAFVFLQRAADLLMRGADETLKPFGLSHTQYNLLRILRGAGPAGLACREAACRMITRDPDMTRLLDRLEARGLVARSRDRKDRRVIAVRITDGGLGLLKQLDQPVLEMHRRQLGHLGEAKLRLLIGLLKHVVPNVGRAAGSVCHDAGRRLHFQPKREESTWQQAARTRVGE